LSFVREQNKPYSKFQESGKNRIQNFNQPIDGKVGWLTIRAVVDLISKPFSLLEADRADFNTEFLA
jgi:hypothetical protein